MSKNKKNFMDFIPVCNPEYTWDADKKGIVTVHVVNKGCRTFSEIHSDTLPE